MKKKVTINSKETLDNRDKDLEAELRSQIIDIGEGESNINDDTAFDIDTNGHKEDDDIKDEIDNQPIDGEIIKPTDKTTNKEDDEYEFEEEDTETPGKGFFFKVKEEHLPEMSRLNGRQIPAIALEHTYNEILNGSTKSVFEIYAPALMRYMIGDGGKGREEYSVTSVAKQREKSESNYIGREL